MADFQKTLTKQNGGQTYTPKGAPPSVAGPLQTVSDLFSSVLKGKAATAQAAEEAARGGADSVYLEAQRALAEEEAATAEDFSELEALSSKMPKLFEDGQLDAAETEQLKPYTQRLERIKLILDPARRTAEMRKLKAKFLNDGRLDMAKAEDVKRLSDAFNINIVEKTAEERYGEAIIKQTREKYVNPTPFHYAMTAELNRTDDEVARAVKALELKSKQGALDEQETATTYGAIIHREFFEHVLALDNEFNNNGGIDTQNIVAFQVRMRQALDSVKGQIQLYSYDAQRAGKSFDANAVNKQLEDQAATLLDLTKRYGEDPSIPARQRKLIQSLTDRPELWQTREFLEMAYKADMSFDTIRGYLANNNLGELFTKLNVPMPDRKSLDQGVKMLFQAMSSLSSGAMTSPDDGLEKLRQHIALKWASSTPSQDTPKDKVPAPVVYKAVQTISAGTPDQVFKALVSNPGLIANAEADPQTKASTVAMVRNNLRLLVDELGDREIQRVGNSYWVANAGSTVGGTFGVSKDTRLTDSLNNAVAFLNTGQAAKLLGGTYERELILATASKKPVPKQERVVAKAPAVAPAPDVTPAKAGKWKRPEPEKVKEYQATYEPLIRKVAEESEVDPDLLISLVEQESAFDPGATSHAGAAGLAQLMPSTAASLGLDKDSLYDPEENLAAGAEYLGMLLKKYKGNVELALAAYNAGPGNVRKHGGIPPFEETQNYVKKIKLAYEMRKLGE